MSFTGITKAYGKLENRPVLESAVLGTAGALIGRYGTKAAARLALGLSLIGKSSEEKELAYEEMKRGDSFKSLQNLMTLAGASVGAAYPALKNYNSKISTGDNLSKFINKQEFYKNNPEVQHQEIMDALHNPPRAVQYVTGNPFDSGRLNKEGAVKAWSVIFNRLNDKSGLNKLLIEMEKEATENKVPSDKLRNELCLLLNIHGHNKEAFLGNNEISNTVSSFTHPVIPVHQSSNLIDRDEFLTLGDKSRVKSLLGSTSEGSSGHVSGMDLAGTAIKAGIGMGAGIAFGSTMGKLFSLPKAQTERLSDIGAVAGALYNTGILSKGF
jgi:hypothetical protein